MSRNGSSQTSRVIVRTLVVLLAVLTMGGCRASSNSASTTQTEAVSTSSVETASKSSNEAAQARWNEPFSTLQLDPAQIVWASVEVYFTGGPDLPRMFPEDATDPGVTAKLSALVATLQPSAGGAVEGLPRASLSLYLDDGRTYHVLSFAGRAPLQIKSFVGGEMVDLDVVQSADVSAYLDAYLDFETE